jgi:hypothetical protein
VHGTWPPGPAWATPALKTSPPRRAVWAQSETLIVRELGVRHRAVPNGEDEAVPPTVSPLPPATRGGNRRVVRGVTPTLLAMVVPVVALVTWAPCGASARRLRQLRGARAGCGRSDGLPDAIGAVGTIVWLAMIRAVRRRQRWARLVAEGAPSGHPYVVPLSSE